MKVRTGGTYTFKASFWDVTDGGHLRGRVADGDLVKVVRLPGCPPPNTMGHAHVVRADDGEFVGLVSTNSLYKQEDGR